MYLRLLLFCLIILNFGYSDACDMHGPIEPFKKSNLTELSIKVTCNASHLAVSFNTCPFVRRGYNLTDLVLLGPAVHYNPFNPKPNVSEECRLKLDTSANNNETKGRFVIPVTAPNFASGACGSIFKYHDSYMSITHRVITLNRVAIDGNGAVVRNVRTKFLYEFTCKYKTFLNNSLHIIPGSLPRPQKLVQTSYNISIKLYRDSQYNQLIASGNQESISLPVAMRVFASVDLDNAYSNFRIRLEKCSIYFVPNGGPKTNIYNIITDYCPAADPSGEAANNPGLTENCQSPKARFSFVTFYLTQHAIDQQRFCLECTAHACNPSATDANCACPTCSGRKKREVEDKVDDNDLNKKSSTMISFRLT